MIVILLLEIIGSSVGAYNLAKGVYNMYTDAGIIKQQYLEYQNYQNVQKKRFDQLTQSQYACFEDDFAIL